MQNVHLLGVRQVDRVDLRLSFLVVAAFAAITIISYVNELSRAGLLDRHRHKQLYVPYLDVHSRSRHRVERSVDEYGALRDDALIQKNGQVHQLGLEIHNIKKALSRHKGNYVSQNREQEINIAVHLGRNASYLTANNSAIRVYHFNNTMPNFYTSLQVPSFPIHDNSAKELNDTRVILKTWIRAINASKQTYRKATAVLVYQHDPGGYLTRDCLRSLVHDHHLTAPTNPLNIQYRKEWDMMPKFKRNAFKVLYGGLSFGVCEGTSHPCTYMVMVKHPLDRILTVYNICQKNTSSILCHFNKLNVQNMTLQQFIKVQGSSFFRKLLYYSKHCKLVGDDEICLPDTKTSFVLTSQERHTYLENILENLEKWFSVIGLEEHFNESLLLFESVFGLNYTGCSKPTRLRELMRMDRHLWPLVSGAGRDTLHGFHNMSEFSQVQNVTYKAIREKLLRDPQVSKWLSADMAIYAKLEELFKKQLEIFNVTTSVMKTLQNPTLSLKVATRFSTLKHGMHVKRAQDRSHVDRKIKHGHTKHVYVQDIHSVKHDIGHKNKQHRNNKTADGDHGDHSNVKHKAPRTLTLTGHPIVAKDIVQGSKQNSTNENQRKKLVGNKVSHKDHPKNEHKNVPKQKHLNRDEILRKIESSYEKLNRMQSASNKKIISDNLPNMLVHDHRNRKVQRNASSIMNNFDSKQSDKNKHNRKDNPKLRNNHKTKNRNALLQKHSDHNGKQTQKKHQASVEV